MPGRAEEKENRWALTQARENAARLLPDVGTSSAQNQTRSLQASPRRAFCGPRGAARCLGALHRNCYAEIDAYAELPAAALGPSPETAAARKKPSNQSICRKKSGID